MEISKYIEKRCTTLKDIAATAAKELQTTPDGRLSTYSYRGSYQYWHRKGGKGEYLPKSKSEMISALAQKAYNKALEKHISQELKHLEGLMALEESEPWEKAMADLAPGARSFVKPPVQADEEYLKNWLGQKFKPLEYERNASFYFSGKGEKMRSKSEVIISNALREYNIPYLYEKPVTLGKEVTVYPDFTILKLKERREIIWEHFGMMDKPDYQEAAIKKLSRYYENGYFDGINLITTFETKEVPLDVRVVRSKIEAYLV